MYGKRCLTVAAAVLLSACSDPMDASKEHLGQALQEYFDLERACFKLPQNLPWVMSVSMIEAAGWQDHQRALRELVRLGFIEERATESEYEVLWQDADYRGQTATEPAFSYSLTEEGRRIARPYHDMADGTHICYGRYRLVEVLDRTEPERDMFGTLRTEVSYRYEAVEVADWAATSQVLQQLFPQIRTDVQALRQPVAAMQTLSLHNTGWKHERTEMLRQMFY